MTEEEFVTAFRWIVGAAFVLIALSWAPGLVSAPSDGSVVFGILMLIGAVFGAASSVMGRYDEYLRIAYFHILHAFFK